MSLGLHLTPKVRGLAQLARALALQARGHRFDSDILHYPLKDEEEIFDMLIHKKL